MMRLEVCLMLPSASKIDDNFLLRRLTSKESASDGINNFQSQPVSAIDKRRFQLGFLDEVSEEMLFTRMIKALYTSFRCDATVGCL